MINYHAHRQSPDHETRARANFTERHHNVALAAIAREAIELFADATRLERLRRCANPDCTMVFLATNRRRQWCTADACGNRIRVARHYRRTHEPGTPSRER
jgi:predicted RNA-binding Zn ribbon-like protein